MREEMVDDVMRVMEEILEVLAVGLDLVWIFVGERAEHMVLPKTVEFDTIGATVI